MFTTKTCSNAGHKFRATPNTMAISYCSIANGGGLFALCSLGNVAWANDPPIYISGSANPTTINVSESIRFESVWHDPEDDFVVGARVKYCHQNTSNCVTTFLDYIEGTEHPRVGAEIQISITEAGTYNYQFFAVDAEPVDNPLHRDEELDWYDGGTFTVVDNTTTPTTPTTPDPDTPDDPVTPPPSQGSTDCTQVTEIPQAECEALVALYNSTNGPNWFDSPANNWNMTNEPCRWEGIRCDCDWESWNWEDSSCDYHINDIILWDKNLIGKFPNLSAFSNLGQLDLSNNQLHGSIPDLSKLSNLYYLSLGGNNLSGRIPDLSNLTNLSILYLFNNQLSGPIPNLSNLTKLEHLSLSSNFLNGPIPNLDTLTNLITLDLNGNQLGGTIPDVGNLKKLESLHLAMNHLSGDIPSSLSMLNNLNGISLFGNCLTASDPTLITFLDSKVPDWKSNQRSDCPSGTHLVSGTVSLPTGNIIPQGGIRVNIIVCKEESSYCGYSSRSFIPEQSLAHFALAVPDDPNIRWSLHLSCNDWEWNEALGESVQSGKCDKYVDESFYSTFGTTTSWGDHILFQGGQNYPNVNLVLLPGVPISGTIYLPQGKVAPVGGLGISINAYEPTENGESSGKYITIPQGESTMPYSFNIVDNAQAEWIVNYWCNSCEEAGYKRDAYYSPTGTTTDFPTGSLLQGGQNHSNINLTLLPLDAETPTDETQPPTINISEYPSTISGKESINLSGTASANTVKITWQNNQGGEGEATITTKDDAVAWTLDNIPLKIGENVITITAYDDTGLQSSEEITITVPEPDFNISAVYPNGGTYNRNERVLTVWWTTTDTSHSTNVKIFLFNGNNREILSESTPDDEQETFIIRDDIQAKDWLVCISTVPMTARNNKCASGNITIQ